MLKRYIPLVRHNFNFENVSVLLWHRGLQIRFLEEDLILYLERGKNVWIIHENGKVLRNYLNKEMNTNNINKIKCFYDNNKVFLTFDYISDVRSQAFKLKECIYHLL